MKGTIKSKERISWLFTHGSKYAGEGFLALYYPCEKDLQQSSGVVSEASGKTAFIAGKKLGGAPARNRAKRLLREAAREAGAPWNGYDVVFIARSRIFDNSFANLTRAVKRLGTQLNQKDPEAPDAPLYEGDCPGGEEKGIVLQGVSNTAADYPDSEEKSSSSEIDTCAVASRDPLSCSSQPDSGLTRQCGKEAANAETGFDKRNPSTSTSTDSTTHTNSPGTTILAFIVGIPQNIAIVCINIYRHAISPLFPPSCRYVPTCSEYALIAFQRFGFWKGLWLAVKRLSRCHPFVPGGYDPVPEKEQKKIV